MPCSLISCHRKLSQGIAENKNQSVQKEASEIYKVRLSIGACWTQQSRCNLWLRKSWNYWLVEAGQNTTWKMQAVFALFFMLFL